MAMGWERKGGVVVGSGGERRGEGGRGKTAKGLSPAVEVAEKTQLPQLKVTHTSCQVCV